MCRQAEDDCTPQRLQRLPDSAQVLYQRRDEAAYATADIERLSAALRKLGVSKKILDEALRDIS